MTHSSGSAPRFSILTPVYDTPERYLVPCVESVLAQEFTSWELILVDDGSPAPHVASLLTALAARDPRIRVVRRAANGGIVAASNDALAAATGEFVALLDHDDLLSMDALLNVNAAITSDGDVDLIYTDEDKVADDGTFYGPFFKPHFSISRLRSQMYLGHLLVLRRTLVDELGGFRADYEGSQDYDLALRVAEKAGAILHVPGVNYHWRAAATSTAMSPDAKPYAFTAAIRAIEDHCRRTGIAATVEQVHEVGVYRLHWTIDPQPLVSIVIPTRGSAAIVDGRFRTLVTGAVRSIIERTTYQNYEVVIVADRSTPPAVIEELVGLLGDRLRLVWFDRPFNFSDKVNVGTLASAGDFVLLLNDDTEVITPTWLHAMVGPALQPGVGMVGAMLYFSDGTIQHAGHHYARGDAGHIGWREPPGEPGYFGGLLVEREACGVTAACALVSREAFFDVGGFTLHLPNNFNDVDFSLKMRSSGRRIVWTPAAELFHYESKTRVPSVAVYEVEFIQRRWSMAMQRDPYWWEQGEAIGASVPTVPLKRV